MLRALFSDRYGIRSPFLLPLPSLLWLAGRSVPCLFARLFPHLSNSKQSFQSLHTFKPPPIMNQTSHAVYGPTKASIRPSGVAPLSGETDAKQTISPRNMPKCLLSPPRCCMSQFASYDIISHRPKTKSTPYLRLGDLPFPSGSCSSRSADYGDMSIEHAPRTILIIAILTRTFEQHSRFDRHIA
jgi:hypothetical protein